MTKLAIVLIRGRMNRHPDVVKTLDQLGLLRKNACAVVADTPTFRGMLMRVKDCTTYGEITDDLVTKLAAKSDDKERIRVGLHPPRGGFERKGIKQSYKKGGALGNRGADMSALIARMI